MPQGRRVRGGPGPATRAPTAARPGARSPPTCCRRSIPGCAEVRPLQRRPNNTGDLDAAKEELQACGKPNGFTTNISYRAERPKEKATAESLQQSLAKVGIKLTIKPYPQGDYFKLYAGKPDFAKKNNLGLMVYGWGADWPDGYGFLAADRGQPRHPGPAATRTSASRPGGGQHARPGAWARPTRRSAKRSGAQIDRKVMDDAYILPGVWAKALLYRPQNDD